MSVSHRPPIRQRAALSLFESAPNTWITSDQLVRHVYGMVNRDTRMALWQVMRRLRINYPDRVFEHRSVTTKHEGSYRMVQPQ